MVLPVDSGEDAVREAALRQEKVARAVEGMEVAKTIYVQNRLINLIVRPSR